MADQNKIGVRRGMRNSAERMATLIIPNGPPGALYDVGVGCFAEFVTLKEFWPTMEVFGCEPNPDEYADVKDIFTGKLLQVALGAEPGRREMWMSPVAIGGSSFHQITTNRTKNREEVEVWTLDQFDAWAGKPDKILLWMDIEGWELEALRGGPELLASGRVEWLNLETRNEDGRPGHPTTRDVMNFLRPLGYRPVYRYNVQGAYPEAPGDVFFFKNGVEPKIPIAPGDIPS